MYVKRVTLQHNKEFILLVVIYGFVKLLKAFDTRGILSTLARDVHVRLIAELWHAKRACGAPWVSKSTHPRKFGNHETVHRPPARCPSVRTTGKPKFNPTLSS